jgi:hypothetical protein
LSRITEAKIRFFEFNPADRIVNRFSKDLFDLDNVLPNAFFDFLLVSFFIANDRLVLQLKFSRQTFESDSSKIQSYKKF